MDPRRGDEKDPPPAMADATPLPPPSAPPLDLDSICCGGVSATVATPTATPLPANDSATVASATVVAPPFLIPIGKNLSKVVIPNSKDWKPPSKLAKKCSVVSPSNYKNASETQQLRKLSVPISAVETVAFLYAKKEKEDADGDATLARRVEANTLGEMKAKRTYRWAVLTRGSLQFKKMSFGGGGWRTMFVDRDSGTANVNVSTFDLRGVHVASSDVAPDNSNDDEGTVIVAFRCPFQNGASDTMGYAAYQTPSVGRFLTLLARALMGAYAARPLWSVPVSWTGSYQQLPPIEQEKYAELIGGDGGFSAAMYAAALAFCVGRKVPAGDALRGGQGAVAKRVLDQQPQERFQSAAAPRAINLGKLAVELAGTADRLTPSIISLTQFYPPRQSSQESQGDMARALVLAGLRALSFNLAFRRLKLSVARRGDEDALAFRSALGQALLYNVTLREVDFELTTLTDMGETIGVAWAMNAQPLISRVNFSSCKLNGKDLKWLQHGLARIWCGGTALAESVRLANNPKVPADAWDEFFLAFVDPTTSQNWPREPPPPPNLSFLQELDVRDTDALGPGLLRFARKLRGLRSLKFTSDGLKEKSSSAAELLTSLAEAGAPLERITGENLDASCDAALFSHSATLKELVLSKFRGDAVSLLCGWPAPVPALEMTVGEGYSHSASPWSVPSGVGFSPGSLVVLNVNNFGIDAMGALGSCTYENGLKKLAVHHMRYAQFLATAPMLTGLESCLVHPTSGGFAETLSVQRQVGVPRIETFWTTLAQSKTLVELQLPDQLIGGTKSDELAMVGRFLKTNRSVRRIGFDSDFLLLKVEDVKVLRSAFYGNKKVTDLEYLSKARKFTMQKVGEESRKLWNEVALCKREIKKIFQRAYSKYNSRWRDGPNRDKLPWVERIRVAKRRIGQIERDQKKIATLLDQINDCVRANKTAQRAQDEKKANERLVRREGQLENLGKKKQKFAANLVTKLNKAKLRGRQQKSAKTQLPRSTYYKSANVWPSRKPPNRQNGRPHSYYNHYNDPYYARPYWWYYHPTYYNNNNDWMYGRDDSLYDMDGNDDRESETNNAALGGMLPEVDGSACDPDDPWTNVDALVQQLDSDYGAAVSPEYLALLHEECSELGPDVVENISGTLDDGAALSSKIDEIGEKTNAPPEMVGDIVDRGGFDLAVVESTLADVPEYDPGDVVDADDDVADAGDVVDMYAGAGPRDLDDGGPSFGGSPRAVLAGARRRARARKASRSMRRVRKDANDRLQMGYRNVDLITGKLQRVEEPSRNMWPSDLVQDWIDETRIQQIRAIAKCDLFDIPAVSSQPISLLNQFSPDASYLSSNGIDVVLVTQCSLDRLQNLKAQLTHWTGKASVAIYLKPTECRVDAERQINSMIKEARHEIEGACDGQVWFDVAIALVEGCIEDEPYPINYLRNVALLEARRQHLRLNASLEKSAVLLVDVDFRPSAHLFKALHSRHAARAILNERQVVVCPAFESADEACAKSLSGLKKLTEEGRAEGFHLSHFPQGHGPTRFEHFWVKSMQCNDADVDGFWQETYQIQHENSFEPYVVMASEDVPLYDERFQGYGLNKVSHLATIALQKGGGFTVLPGVFLVAPAHDRSDSWRKRYGTRSDETNFNRLALKGLYYNFTKNLENGGEPVVSDNTRSQCAFLLERVKRLKEEHIECNHALIHPDADLKETVFCY